VPGNGAKGMTEPTEVAAWRTAQRKRLLLERMAIPAGEREDLTLGITQQLEDVIGDPAGLVISAYWPFKGEPDLKPMLKRLRERGAIIALPVVIAKAQPLIFRAWNSGDKLARGVWNIPFPANGPEVEPDVAMAPVVGFDRACFRLGYGGGFFDRTMAALPKIPRFYGVGYSQQEVPTIFPQDHDIAMHAVVTDADVVLPDQ